PTAWRGSGLAFPDGRSRIDRTRHEGRGLPLPLRRRDGPVCARGRCLCRDSAGPALALLLRHRIRAARPAPGARGGFRRTHRLPVDQILLFCYHYDPKLARYSAAILSMVRFGGAAAVVVLSTFLAVMFRRERR